METWPLSFQFANITGAIMKDLIKRRTKIMLWVGITLVLIGVFLIGKSSN